MGKQPAAARENRHDPVSIAIESVCVWPTSRVGTRLHSSCTTGSARFRAETRRNCRSEDQSSARACEIKWINSKVSCESDFGTLRQVKQKGISVHTQTGSNLTVSGALRPRDGGFLEMSQRWSRTTQCKWWNEVAFRRWKNSRRRVVSVYFRNSSSGKTVRSVRFKFGAQLMGQPIVTFGVQKMRLFENVHPSVLGE